MIAMTVSVIIVGCILMVYVYHEKLFKRHEIISNLQQNLRAAMYIMESEIRMAGLDPLDTAHPMILTANNHNFRFQLDRNCNGTRFKDPEDFSNGAYASSGDDENEEIQYGFNSSKDSLARESWDGGMKVIVDNIEILDFRFFDANGKLLNDEDNSDEVPRDQRQDIRSVEITLVSRSDREYQGHKDITEYKNLNKTVLLNADDHYYRKTLSKRILLRNM